MSYHISDIPDAAFSVLTSFLPYASLIRLHHTSDAIGKKVKCYTREGEHTTPIESTELKLLFHYLPNIRSVHVMHPPFDIDKEVTSAWVMLVKLNALQVAAAVAPGLHSITITADKIPTHYIYISNRISARSIFDSDVEIFKGMKYVHLKKLRLDEITDNAFSHFKGIHTLILEDIELPTYLTDAAFSHLEGIHTLRLSVRQSLHPSFTHKAFEYLKGIHTLDMDMENTCRTLDFNRAFSYLTGIYNFSFDCWWTLRKEPEGKMVLTPATMHTLSNANSLSIYPRFKLLAYSIVHVKDEIFEINYPLFKNVRILELAPHLPDDILPKNAIVLFHSDLTREDNVITL